MSRFTPARWPACVLAIGCALAVAACGSSSKSSSGASSTSSSGSSGAAAKDSSKPFKVLMVADTTGPTKVYGDQDVIAEKAGAAYWNKHGGIGGRQITVEVASDNGDPTTAVTVLTKWVAAHGKPDLLFPGTSGVDSAGLVPAAKRMHILAVGVDDGGAICRQNAQTGCPTEFIPGATALWQSVTASQWLKKQGYKKVGLLIEDDAFSQTEIAPLQSELKKLGIASTAVSFPPTAVNIVPQLSKLKSAKIDVLFGAALGPAAGYIAAAREKLGLVDSLPLLFDPGAAAVDLTKLATASSLKNSWEETQPAAVPTAKLPGRDALLQYAKPFGVLDQPLYVAAYEWDDLVAVHDAAAQAKSTAVDDIVKAMESLQDQYVNDPLWMTNKAVKWSADSHESILGSAESNVVVPSGPLKNGMVQSAGA